MEKEKLIELHKEQWEKIRQILPHDLELPFIEIDSPQAAFNNMNTSITGKEQDVGYSDADVPSSMRAIEPGMFYDFNFYFGGVLMPKGCLNDSDLENKAGLTHEQIHEVLRNQVLAYGLNGFFELRQPILAKHFNLFTDLVTHGYSVQALESDGISAEDYYRVPVAVYNPRMRKFQGLPDNQYTIEEEIELMVKQDEEFMSEIKEFDPIKQYHFCLEKYLDMYVNSKPERELCRAAVMQITQLNFLAQMRTFDGVWKKTNPVVNPKGA